MKHILLISLLFVAACKDFDIEHTITCDSTGAASWRLHILELPDAKCYQDPETCESDVLDFIKILEEAGGTNIEIIHINTEPPFEYIITAYYEELEEILIVLAEDEPEMFVESITDGLRIQLWEEGTLPNAGRIAAVDKGFIPVKLVALGGDVSLKDHEPKRLVNVGSLGDLHGLRLTWKEPKDLEDKH